MFVYMLQEVTNPISAIMQAARSSALQLYKSINTSKLYAKVISAPTLKWFSNMISITLEDKNSFYMHFILSISMNRIICMMLYLPIYVANTTTISQSKMKLMLFDVLKMTMFVLS